MSSITTPIILDVREKDEFDAEHVKDSLHLPMAEFHQRAPSLLKHLNTAGDRPIILMCASGRRASIVATQCSGAIEGIKLEVFSGGIAEWKNQGLPTVVKKSGHLPLIRQVQLIAGLLVLTGVGLAHWVHPGFLLLSAFVGAGLTVAGATGFCGLAELLARMPWNRTCHASQTTCGGQS